jgi:hypothetical protein
MASTPHVPPKSTPTDDKAKADEKAKAPEAPHKAPEAKAAAPKQDSPTLTGENAWVLFSNGHRLAKQGDDPTKWISMSRASDGVATVTSPMTSEIEQSIKDGQYYLVEDQGAYTLPPPPEPPEGPPTVVDVPHVSAMGAVASCTMGNWTNVPTSYTYAWQRDGSPISGATSADYTMVAADTGKGIGCIVTATNAAGSTAAPLSNTVVGP